MKDDRGEASGSGDLHRAYANGLLAFERDPSDDAAAREVERLAVRTGRLADLIARCNELLAGVAGPETRVELCARLGRWYQEACHPEYAAACLERALAERPDHRGALGALATLYRSQRRSAELSELLVHLASVAVGPDRRDALVELGELYERSLEDPERAAVAFRAALDADPSSAPAASGLGRTAVERDDFVALAAALEGQRRAGADPAAAVAVDRKLAEIYVHELDEPVLACAALQRILELAPGDGRALRDLDPLLESAGRWAELVPVLEGRIEQAPSERGRVSLLLRLAVLLDSRLGRAAEAAGRLEQALALDGSHEEALERLGDLYRRLGAWEDLARTCSRHVAAATDPEVVVRLQTELASVCFERLDDPLAAVEALENASRIDGTDLGVLEGLARVHASIEDWVSAEEALERLAELVDEPAARAGYLHRAAMLLSGPLDDLSGALRALRSGLEIDPTHQPSLRTCIGIHLELEQWQEAAIALEQLQDLAGDGAARSRHLAELAALNLLRLGNPARAVECLELALESDPQNAAAGARLARLYVDDARLVEASALLGRMLDDGTAEALGAEEVAALRKLQGKAALSLGDREVALRAFGAAGELAPGDASTEISLAELQVRQGSFDDAVRSCEALLGRREPLPVAEAVATLHALGLAEKGRGRRKKALEALGRAVELDPDHFPSHQALAELHEAASDWGHVVQHRRALVRGLEGAARVAALVDLSDLCIEKLKEPHGATEHVEAALELEPTSLPLLHRLLELSTTSGRWRQATETILRLVALESDAARIARYHRTLAVICRDRLDEPDRAAQHFEACLDHDPSQLKAFEAIDRLLTERKDWLALERSYRRMIERIRGRGETALEAHLWHLLGEVRRSRIGAFDSAAEAFRAASRLEPEDLRRHAILAELYERIPGEGDRAIAEHQLLVRAEPTRTRSYSALRALYQASARYDEAFCLCAALCFVGKASPDERLFFRDYEALNVPGAGPGVGSELWVRDLVAPEEDLYLGKVFETVLPALRRERVQPHRAFALRRRDRLEPDAGPETPGGRFGWASRALGMSPPPELYAGRSADRPLLYAPTEPAASIIALDRVEGLGPSELRFELGRHLALYRGEHYVLCLEPSIEGLRRVLLAAVRLVSPTATLPGGEDSGVDETAAMLRTGLAPIELERLVRAVRALLAAEQAVDLARWRGAVELTACRAGLLLAGDLGVAARMLERRPPEVPGLSLPEVVARLVAFSVSEAYFRLREAVGFSIEQNRAF